MKYSVGILPLSLASPSPWPRLIREAACTVSTRLYVLWSGGCTDEAGPDLIRLLTTTYDAIAKQAPLLDLVPLCGSAGWTLNKASCIPDIEVIFDPSVPPSAAAQASQASSAEGQLLPQVVDARRAAALTTLPIVPLCPEDLQASDYDLPPPPAPCEYTSTLPSSLQLSQTAVGGTFDHLHAGHRLMLATSALVTAAELYVGLASDQLLASKKHRQFLHAYEDRAAAVRAFLAAVNPRLHIHISNLPSKEPPLAATVKEFDGLVISRETVSGGDSIQQYRAKQGFEPLTVVVVDLVGAASQDPDAPKLSSTALRQAEQEASPAAAAPAGAPAGAGDDDTSAGTAQPASVDSVGTGAKRKADAS